MQCYVCHLYLSSTTGMSAPLLRYSYAIDAILVYLTGCSHLVKF